MDSITIFVAKFFILIPVLLTGYQLYRLNNQQRVEYVIKLAAGGALSVLIAVILRQIIDDPRPFVAGHFTPLISHSADNGFPSDHTLLAAFLAWLLLTYSRTLGAVALTVAALVGLARMAAGVHHSWDILGSFAITWVAVLAVSRLYTAISAKRN